MNCRYDRLALYGGDRLRHNRPVQKRCLAPFVALILAGCSGSREYFPLEEGRVWTYSVRSGLAKNVVDVKVTARVPVGSARGYRLEGPLGVSRVAWDGDRLISDCLPNTRIAPPLPLLAPKEKKPISWQGFVETMGKTVAAKATLTHSHEKKKIGSQPYDTVVATLEMKVGDRRMELKTWYAPEIGPILQEQRTVNSSGVSELDIGLNYLGSR